MTKTVSALPRLTSNLHSTSTSLPVLLGNRDTDVRSSDPSVDRTLHGLYSNVGQCAVRGEYHIDSVVLDDSGNSSSVHWTATAGTRETNKDNKRNGVNRCQLLDSQGITCRVYHESNSAEDYSRVVCQPRYYKKTADMY